MISLPIVFLMATLGQCPPGYLCPEPRNTETPAFSPVTREKTWHRIKLPDGSKRVVWGWKLANGNISWYPDEQPETPPEAVPGPSPQPAPATQKPEPINYGIDVAKLKEETRTIRASDSETLRMVTEAAKDAKSEAPASDCSIPNPFKKVQRAASNILTFLGALAFLTGGFILFALGRRFSQ